MIDDDQPVAQPLGFFHVVRRVNQRLAALLQRLQIVEDGVAALRVDAHGRLVEQQDLRIVQQGGGQVEPPLHAAAERAHLILCAVAEAHQIERLCYRLLCRGAIQIVKGAEKSQVVVGGQFIVEGDVLRHQPDLPLGRIGVAAQSAAVDQNLAGIGTQQPGDDGNRRGFTGAVGAQQPDGLARGGAQRNAIDRH